MTHSQLLDTNIHTHIHFTYVQSKPILLYAKITVLVRIGLTEFHKIVKKMALVNESTNSFYCTECKQHTRTHLLSVAQKHTKDWTLCNCGV